MIERLASLKDSILNKGVVSKIACLCCAALLSACASDGWYEGDDGTLETSGPARLKQVASMQDRLDRVGGKLLINNAPLCRKQLRNLLGFSVANKYTYSADQAALATETLGLGERLQVMNVIPDSGAERAGLKHGDILLKIDNRPVPRGPQAERNTVEMLSSIVSTKKSLNLTVLRNRAPRKLSVDLTPACGFRLELGQTANVNAYSDGNRILVTQGMMLVARSDEELAYVISKEMAHNVLDHAKVLQNTRASATLIDNMLMTPPRMTTSTAMKPFPKKFDIDADTLGLAMTLRGGYEIDNAPRFWRRLAYRSPANSARNYTTLHPSTSARLDAMPNAIQRVKAIDKRRRALATSK